LSAEALTVMRFDVVVDVSKVATLRDNWQFCGLGDDAEGQRLSWYGATAPYSPRGRELKSRQVCVV
jgi:hypothetical protein